MAKTLIGQLIFRLRTEGLGEAQKVTNAMRQVEAASMRLAKSGSTPWGNGFQRQLDQLRLSAKDMKEVERSWIHLHDTMKSRSMADALQKNSIAHWKTNTISTLAQQRAAIDAHFKAIEVNAPAHGKRMSNIMRALTYSLGVYSGIAGVGMAGREGLRAASERSRVDAENYYRGLSDSERSKIETAADEVSGRRRVSKTSAMEVAADAAMNFPSTDAALQTLDTQIAAFKAWANTYGEETAIGYLRAFNRAMDNINVDSPDEYKGMIDNFMKAWQVTGKDVNPQEWAQAIKYARSSGKVFSHDFLSRVLPFVIAETGGSDAGTQLRAGFDQFIVGRATRESLETQDSYGLRQGVQRDKKGKMTDAGALVQGDLFAQNPLEWFNKVLLPKLQERGVDTGNAVTLAEEIGSLTNNRLSSDSAIKAILGWVQMSRQLNERFPNAKGLAAADSMDDRSLSSSTDALVTSFGNLAAAVIPVQSVINPALNSLADGINALAAVAKDNPALAALGMGVAGAGLYGGGKFALGALADVFGLKSSAIALDGSAAALTRAAIALGGSAVTDGTPDLKKGTKGGWGKLSGVAAGSIMGAWAMLTQAMGDTPGETFDDQVKNQRQYREFLERLFGVGTSTNPAGTPEVQSGLALDNARRSREAGLPASTDTMPGKTADDLDIGRGAIEASRAAGQEIQQNLSVTASPTVDTASMERALGIARALKNEIVSAGAAASRIDRNMGAEMRRNFADTAGGGGF